MLIFKHVKIVQTLAYIKYLHLFLIYLGKYKEISGGSKHLHRSVEQAPIFY